MNSQVQGAASCRPTTVKDTPSAENAQPEQSIRKSPRSSLDPKYIVVQGKFNMPAAVLFSPIIQHDAMAGNHVVLGAGFWCGEAYGHSESLGITSRAEDTEIIRAVLAGN